jgi:hypothetical protein
MHILKTVSEKYGVGPHKDASALKVKFAELVEKEPGNYSLTISIRSSLPIPDLLTGTLTLNDYSGGSYNLCAYGVIRKKAKLKTAKGGKLGKD